MLPATLLLFWVTEWHQWEEEGALGEYGQERALGVHGQQGCVWKYFWRRLLAVWRKIHFFVWSYVPAWSRVEFTLFEATWLFLSINMSVDFLLYYPVLPPGWISAIPGKAALVQPHQASRWHCHVPHLWFQTRADSSTFSNIITSLNKEGQSKALIWLWCWTHPLVSHCVVMVLPLGYYAGLTIKLKMAGG